MENLNAHTSPGHCRLKPEFQGAMEVGGSRELALVLCPEQPLVQAFTVQCTVYKAGLPISCMMVILQPPSLLTSFCPFLLPILPSFFLDALIPQFSQTLSTAGLPVTSPSPEVSCLCCPNGTDGIMSGTVSSVLSHVFSLCRSFLDQG